MKDRAGVWAACCGKRIRFLVFWAAVGDDSWARAEAQIEADEVNATASSASGCEPGAFNPWGGGTLCKGIGVWLGTSVGTDADALLGTRLALLYAAHPRLDLALELHGNLGLSKAHGATSRPRFSLVRAGKWAAAAESPVWFLRHHSHETTYLTFFGVEPGLSVSRLLGQRWELFGNVGYRFFGNADTVFHGPQAQLGASVRLSRFYLALALHRAQLMATETDAFSTVTGRLSFGYRTAFLGGR